MDDNWREILGERTSERKKRNGRAERGNKDEEKRDNERRWGVGKMERKKETTEREGKKKNTGQGDGRRTRREI